MGDRSGGLPGNAGATASAAAVPAGGAGRRHVSAVEPSADKSPPPASQDSKESPSSLERVPAREDGPFWYFLGAPLGSDVFPGMSGAGSGWRRREVPGAPGGTAIW